MKLADIEDVQGNISISDLTFNDFKIDLEKLREELKTIEKLPQSSFSVVRQIQTIQGLFSVLKTNQEKSPTTMDQCTYPIS